MIGASSNAPRETIDYRLRDFRLGDRKELIYTLKTQKYIQFDFNSETPMGHNKREGETLKEYVKRVMDCEYLYREKGDFGLYDCCPCANVDINAKAVEGMSSSTYYFSYSEGIRKRNRCKQREALREPSKSSRSGVGFDLDCVINLKYHGSPNEIANKPRVPTTPYERLLANIKLAISVVSFVLKYLFENLLHLPPPAEHLNNLLNSKMNNLTAIDYANKDLTHDGDQVLPRWG